MIKICLRMFSLLFCVSLLTFTLVRISPVDPLQVNVGQSALAALSSEQVAKLETYWGKDSAPLDSYLAWAGGFIRGDMGVSLLYRQEVSSVIAQKLSNSLLLLTFAWLFSGISGFALGVVAGSKQGSTADKLIRGYALLTASTPAFWLALIFLLVFAVWLKALPIGLSVPIGLEAGAVTLADRLRHAVLPAVTLSLVSVAPVILHTREKIISVMESDYVLFALARGESWKAIIRRHGLRNVALPAVSLQFASIGEIFGGSVLVEQVFSYPGLGQAAVTAGLGGDIPLLMAIAVIAALFVFAGNLSANLLCSLIDPRLRKGRGA